MNHFFALKLTEEGKQIIHSVAEEWRSAVMPARWYDPEDYHVTLKFLGNLDEVEQPRLIEAAMPVAEETLPFALCPASYGGFPNMYAPNVLWAGVEISPELEALATRLDQAMSAIGFRVDRRRYHPHITVARCRLRTTRFSNDQARLVPEDWPLPSEHLFLPFVSEQFVLMQTRSGEGRANRMGLRYNTVHTFPFGAAHSSDVS